MASPTDLPSSSSSSSSTPPPTSPPTNLLGRFWNTASSTTSALYSRLPSLPIGFISSKAAATGGAVSSGVAHLVKPVGRGLVSGATDQIEQAMFNNPNSEWIQLEPILSKLMTAPTTISCEEIKFVNSVLKPLMANKNKLLKELLVGISPENINICNEIIQKVITIAEDPNLDSDPSILNSYIQWIQEKNSQLKLNKFNALFNNLINSKKGAFSRYSEQLTEKAHPLLTDSRQKLIDLQKAIANSDNNLMKSCSIALEKLLEQLIVKEAEVFKKKKLDPFRCGELSQIKEILPSFYGETPPTKSEMLGAVELGINILEPYYEAHAGLAERGVDIISTKLNSTVDASVSKALSLVNQLDKKVTDQAHPLLSKSHLQLQELQDAILEQNTDTIKHSSTALRNVLLQLLKNKDEVFTKQPLKASDLTLIELLTEYLPCIINENPPSHEEMKNAVKAVLSVINKYYEDQAGLAERIVDIPTAKITSTINSNISKGVELTNNLAQQLTKQAHPLLSETRQQLAQLQAAITAENTAAIKTYSASLEELLRQLIDKRRDAFKEIPLSDRDSQLFSALIENLPAFYAEQPPTQKIMADTITAALNVIDHYYKKDAGLAERTVDIPISKINSTIDSNIAKGVELTSQLEERMTKKAHHLYSNSRTELIELQKAISSQNKEAIKKCSKTLEPLLEQLISNHLAVFDKQPIDPADLKRLSEFKEKLSSYYEEKPPAQRQMTIEVEEALSSLNYYYTHQSGTAERTADVFSEKIVDAATRAGNNLSETITNAIAPLNNIVRTNVDNLIGKKNADKLLGALPSKAISSTQSTEKTEEEGDSASGFLSYGGSLLKTMMEKGGQALSKEAMSSFAKVLTLGLGHVLGKMDKSKPYEEPRAALESIISALSKLPENGNWTQLYDQFKEASKILEPFKLTVNGFHIPLFGSASKVEKKAEGSYSDNMSLLQDAIDGPPKEPENQDWKSLAQKEKNKLVSNTTHFLTIKHIYENVCGLRPIDEKFYLRLLAKSKKNGNLSSEELKKLLFEELDKNNVGFLTKISARIQYYFYGKLVKRYTAKTSTIYFNEAFNYIDSQKEEKFGTLRNQVTTNFTRYLTILGGAYKTVANNPARTGTLDEMIKTELEKKESNLGFETEQLYSEFANTILEKTFNSSIAAWIVNKFLKLLIGDPEKIVRTIVNKTTGSLHDTRGYSYALNTVIREQLDEIWRLLQADHVNAQSGKQSEITEELSEGQKSQLKALVKNLIEILRKSKCATVDELHDLVKGKLLSAKVNQAVDDMFIEEALEKVTHLLAKSIQTLIKEDQLQKLTYKFASLVNRTFEVGEEVAVAKMQDEERHIAKRSEQILRLTINSAIEEKFDFAGNKQQKETNRFIQDLHDNSRTYFDIANQDLTELAQMNDAPLEAKNSKIDKIAREALAYESECYVSTFQAKTSKINSDNKDEISKRYLGIAEESRPFVEAVADLRRHARTLDEIQIAAPLLQHNNAILSSAWLNIFNKSEAKLEDIDSAESQLKAHEDKLKQLNVALSGTKSIQQINSDSQNIKTIQENIHKAIELKKLGTELSQNNSLLHQVANEKKNHLGPNIQNAALKQKFDSLKQQLEQTVNNAFLPRLLNKLSNIEKATQAEHVEQALQEVLALLKDAVAQTDKTIEDEREKYQAGFGKRIFIGPIAQIEDNNYVASQMKILDSHLDELKNAQTLKESIEKISNETKAVAISLVNLRKAVGMRSLSSSLAQPNSLFDEIAIQKKSHLRQILPNAELQSKFARLKDELERSFSGTFLPQLLGKLKNIEEAILAEQIDTAHQEFLKLLRDAIAQANKTIDEEKQKYWICCNNINEAVNATHLLDSAHLERSKKGVGDSIAKAQEHLKTLSDWEAQHIKEVPYINFSLINMKGIQDWAAELVYGRIRERLDGFMGLLKREETYRYGLLNHLFLIPYTQAMRGDKK